MKSSLNIYILGDYRPGLPDGLAEFSYQNVTLLKDRFHFHFVEFSVNENLKFYEAEEVDGLCIHKFGVIGKSTWALPERFKEWLSQIPVKGTVFHLNHVYNFQNFLVARYLTKLEIKYLHTPHDSYVYGIDFKRSRQIFKRIYRQIFISLIDKYVLDHASLVHALTERGYLYLKIVTNSPVMIVSNQVRDMEISFDLQNILPLICYIGRNDFYQKGIDRTLQGFALFKTKSQLESSQLILIGPSIELAAEQRGKLISELGLTLDKDVIITGKVSDSERNRTLQQSKVYIHLSRFEGFGISIIQALSASKPVIISKQIPIGETILAYNAGFVVDSPEETARAISHIFALSEEEYLEMSLNARNCYEKEFHPEVVKPKLIKLYETAAQIE